MTNIEKLKALALAATKRRSVSEEIASLYDFQGAANPAAVLELIAEVERLRTELAPGAAAGGNTSNSGIGSDGAAGTVEKDAARYRWFKANYLKYGNSDPDIRRPIILFEGRWYGGHFDNIDDLDTAIDDAMQDAAIEAHNKAGKEQGFFDCQIIDNPDFGVQIKDGKVVE